jgi:hypothetical protein
MKQMSNEDLAEILASDGMHRFWKSSEAQALRLQMKKIRDELGPDLFMEQTIRWARDRGISREQIKMVIDLVYSAKH